MGTITDGDIVALATILAIVTLVFADYEKFALRQLLEKQLISQAQFANQLSRLKRFMLGFLVVAVFIIYAVSQYFVK
jgi:high-affinity nickel permease